MLLPGYLIYAQDNVDVAGQNIASQIWLDYNPSYSLSEKLDYYGEFGARTVFPNEWSRFVIAPSVRYKKPKLIWKELSYKEELHFGIRLFYTANKNYYNRLEIRPFQGYKLSWPNRSRFVLQHYLRLEERFDIALPKWINTFGLRLRYRVKTILKFKGDWLPFGDGLYLPMSMEVFGNLKGAEQFNDVVRVTPGIGYEFSPISKVELELSYHYTRNTVLDNFATNNIVFRFRTYHNF